MIDNDGVVFLVVLYQSTIGGRVYGKFEYSEWVRVVPAPRARLSLSPGSVPETGGPVHGDGDPGPDGERGGDDHGRRGGGVAGGGRGLPAEREPAGHRSGADDQHGDGDVDGGGRSGEHVGQEGVGVGDGGGRRR